MRPLFQIQLLAFPFFEAAFLILAADLGSKGQAQGALGFCLLASVFLSYSVHVTFHEFVHRTATAPYGRWWSLPATIFLGMPLDGYRIHHMNHHAYNNNFRDFSSTWRLSGGKLLPRGPWGYCLGWPRYLARVRKSILLAHRKKHFPASFPRRVREQKFFLLFFLVVLGFTFPRGLALYLLTVYLGWAWISLHNYLQHPPKAPGRITSVYLPLYNLFFCNNGLHREHHHEPGLPWKDLRGAVGKGRP